VVVVVRGTLLGTPFADLGAEFAGSFRERAVHDHEFYAGFADNLTLVAAAGTLIVRLHRGHLVQALDAFAPADLAGPDTVLVLCVHRSLLLEYVDVSSLRFAQPSGISQRRCEIGVRSMLA
jgi:hypothetical protein